MIERQLELAGVRAIVTGSTRGLGEAIARDLTARGARVVVNGTDALRCSELARELSTVGVAGSVADEAVARALVDTCAEHFGGVDVLVNNAGFTRDGMLSKLSAAQFDEVIAVHLRGTWLCTQAAARAMRDTGGAVINVVSGTALYGHLGQSNYAAAKGGILALTRALSLELARYGIRVNAISPRARTRMIEPLLDFSGERRDELAALFGDPEDVAAIVSFLASGKAIDLTGQVLGFDGHELVIWSHPAPVLTVRRDTPWTLGEFATTLSGELAHLHPDSLGRALKASS